MNYDVIIIGAGPGGIFSAYELVQKNPKLNIAVFESGHELSRRRCPIDGNKIKSCIGCKTCSIMRLTKISTIEKMLEESGSDVKAPQKPAYRIK